MKGKQRQTDRPRGNEPVPAPHEPNAKTNVATQFLFRLCAIYLGLFSLATQVAGSLLPLLSFRGLGPLWPMRDITVGIAANVFGVSGPADAIDPKTYGETSLYVVQALWLFTLSAVLALVWTLARRKQAGISLLKWIRLFLRLGLAAQMLEYGMTKVFPTQFPAPPLNTLVTPVGDLQLNALLWASVGAATGYGLFTGLAEVLAGVLLIVPRTAMVGALVCLADLFQVLVLNLSYDIGLKITTIHLVAINVFLLAPDARRLWNFLVMGREAPAAVKSNLFNGEAANRLALWAQLVIGGYLIASFAYINIGYLYAVGQESPRSALYGIWEVEALSIDGEVRPPELNDYDRRWRRVIFDAPGLMALQRTDDSFGRYGASIDEITRTIALTKGNSRIWKAGFTFSRVNDDGLILDGTMDGYQIHVELRRVPFDTLPVLNSNFRWIRPASP